MQNATNEVELKSLNSQPKKVSLPPSISLRTMSHSQGEAKRRRSFDASGSGTMSGGVIGKAFNIKERDHLMVEIARMFYSAGLPFHLARNSYFVSAFSYAATHDIPDFVPPRVPPHKDEEVSHERLKCLKRYFDNHIERTKGTMNPRTWLAVYGSFAPSLQNIALKDIAGDNFDSFDDVGVLEIANLSLDEPGMEAVLFKEVGDEEENNIDDEA
ncbi:hypothetical protein Acr_11g0017130 [Actinidia rufa]|uniref:Uncharacterized protein n=1 Tax=Actinidia rufa TaxID=165716 RepID=A0A7J0FHM4_9ERIC|nr:hypothetical protein Acr_11g0017130 [Actinidia rufa]